MEGNKVVQEGYIGKPKGIYQVLKERGLWVNGMRGKETEADKAKKRANGIPLLDDKLNAHKVLDECEDFASEVIALQELVHSRGHVLLISPKCHPEIAGCGIEYSWGKAKMTYRRDPSTTAKKDFKAKVQSSLDRDKTLTIQRVWKYARRTRDYCRIYYDLENFISQNTINRDDVTYNMLEKQRKVYKTHRNVGEIDRQFIQETS
jgi:hypothetical protein